MIVEHEVGAEAAGQSLEVAPVEGPGPRRDVLPGGVAGALARGVARVELGECSVERVWVEQHLGRATALGIDLTELEIVQLEPGSLGVALEPYLEESEALATGREHPAVPSQVGTVEDQSQIGEILLGLEAQMHDGTPVLHAVRRRQSRQHTLPVALTPETLVFQHVPRRRVLQARRRRRDRELREARARRSSWPASSY